MQHKMSFDKVTMQKIGKGFLIASLGAGLTFLTEQMTTVDFGELQPLVFVFMSVFVNTIREFIKGN